MDQHLYVLQCNNLVIKHSSARSKNKTTKKCFNQSYYVSTLDTISFAAAIDPNFFIWECEHENWIKHFLLEILSQTS
jgi:hypothetical protein